MRVAFGHNAVDNIKDWHDAHEKATLSRRELDAAVQEAELIQQADSLNIKEEKDKS